MNKFFGRLIWRFIPKKTMSRFAGKFARHRISKYFIPLYIKYFDIDLKPIKKPIAEFEHLLDFFIREYHETARPVNQQADIIISPVDGTISQIGKIEQGSLMQVKGITYTLDDLLGGNKEQIDKFMDGNFVTIYLSPKDYHRIHMPATGEIEETTYISGQLYPVNKFGLKYIPGLFARNERFISYIETQNGEICLIKVGATNVGSIKVAYDDQVATNQKSVKKAIHKRYQPACKLQKGEELGRFEFGSTVILLFEPNKIDWLIEAKSGTSLQMGQALARIME